NMFMLGLHYVLRVSASATTPLSVNLTLSWATNPYLPEASTSLISYTGGGVATQGSGTQGITASPRVGSGINYQYPVNMRELWRVGLVALQAYANSAYGGNFETLSSANQLLLLQDLWANKPSSFSNILPS